MFVDCGLEQPNDLKEALQLCNILLTFALDGSA